MARLIVVLSALFLLTIFFRSNAVHAEEGHHTLGVQAGQVNLSGDVGTTYGNALGIGAFFDYAASDYLEFEINYLNSKHVNNNLNMSQSTFGALVQWNIEQFDIFIPYVRGGAEFVSHTQDMVGTTTASYSTTGFGLDAGLGANVLLGTNFMTGLDLTYHSIFDVSVTPAGGTSQKAIQPYTTIMLKLGYVFNPDKRDSNKSSVY